MSGAESVKPIFTASMFDFTDLEIPDHIEEKPAVWRRSPDTYMLLADPPVREAYPLAIDILDLDVAHLLVAARIARQDLTERSVGYTDDILMVAYGETLCHRMYTGWYDLGEKDSSARLYDSVIRGW